MVRALIIISLLNSQNVYALSFANEFVKSAIERTSFSVRYDGSYYSIDYPNGDVPKNIGVCTDVVIRAYRKVGIDLQKLVHEDITRNFDAYPSKRIWGLNKPDKILITACSKSTVFF